MMYVLCFYDLLFVYFKSCMQFFPILLLKIKILRQENPKTVLIIYEREKFSTALSQHRCCIIVPEPFFRNIVKIPFSVQKVY